MDTQTTKISVLENVEALCRSCLSTTSLNNIFELHFQELPFASIFCELLDTTVSYNDTMPKNICKTCITEIISFYEFKRKFNQCDKLLRVLCSTVKHPETCEEDFFDNSSETTCSETVEAHISESSNEGNVVDSSIGELSTKIENEIVNVKNESGIHDVSDIETYLSKRKIICTGCNRKFNILQIKRHNCTVCSICKRNFKRLPALRVHMNSHTDARPYMCEYCGKGFNSGTQLLRHKRIHTGEKPYKCDFCDKKFRVRFSCVSHMRHMHTQTKIPKKVSTHVCPICGISFANRLKCTLHIKAHSKDNFLVKKPKYVKKPENQRKFLCEVCSKVYKSKQALEDHLQTHGEKKYTCTICDKKFSTKNILNGHLKVHNDENNFVCQYCGKRFKYEGILRGHLKLHTGTDYKFKCEICGKRLPTNHKLEVHVRSHTGERPYDCAYCGRSFAQKVNLRVHERLHTGEKPYKCERCQKWFSTSNMLKRHKSSSCCID